MKSPPDAGADVQPLRLHTRRILPSGEVREARGDVILSSDAKLEVVIDGTEAPTVFLRMSNCKSDYQKTPNVPVTAFDLTQVTGAHLQRQNPIIWAVPRSSGASRTMTLPLKPDVPETWVTFQPVDESGTPTQKRYLCVRLTPRPVLDFVDAQGISHDLFGSPIIGLHDRFYEKVEADLYLEIEPVPEGDPSCVALEGVSEDGTILSQVRLRLAAPDFRDGPFATLSGTTVLPRRKLSGKSRGMDGDPSDDAVYPAQQNLKELVSSEGLRIRVIPCR